MTLTFAMDAASGMASFYVDGVLFAARAVDNFEKFSPDGLYTFAIGAQANVNGKDGVQFFEGSFADVKVYDFPLSAANVKGRLYKRGDGNASAFLGELSHRQGNLGGYFRTRPRIERG